MKKEDLFDTVGRIDDKYVQEAATPYKKPARPPSFYKLLGACACIALTVGITVAVVNSPLFKANEGFVSGGDDDSSSGDGYYESDSNAESSPSIDGDTSDAPSSDNSDDDYAGSDDSQSAPYYVLEEGKIATQGGKDLKFREANGTSLLFSAANCDSLSLLVIYREDGAKKYAAYGDISPVTDAMDYLLFDAAKSDSEIIFTKEDEAENEEMRKFSCRFDLSDISMEGKSGIEEIYLVADSVIYLLSFDFS